MSPMSPVSQFLLAILVTAGPALADRAETCRAANPDFTGLCGCLVDRTAGAGFEADVLDQLLGHNYISVPPEEVQRFGRIFLACTREAIAAQMAAEVIVADGSSATEGSSDQPAAAQTSTTGYTLTTPDGVPSPGRWTRGAALERPHHNGTWTVAPARGGFVRDEDGHFLIAGCNHRGLPQLVFGPVAASDGWSAVSLDIQSSAGPLLDKTARPARIEDDLLLAELPKGLMDALRRGSSIALTASRDDGTPPLAVSFGLSGSSAALKFENCEGPDTARVAGFPGILVNGQWVSASGEDTPGARFGAPDTPMENLVLTCDRRLGIAPFPRYGGADPDSEQSAAYGYGLKVDDNPAYQISLHPGAEDDAARGYSEQPLQPALVEQMSSGRFLHVAPNGMQPGDGVYRSYELRGFSEALAGLDCP